MQEPPSLLNNEHKKLIKESLQIAIAHDRLNDKAMLDNINALLVSKRIQSHKPKRKHIENAVALMM